MGWAGRCRRRGATGRGMLPRFRAAVAGFGVLAAVTAAAAAVSSTPRAAAADGGWHLACRANVCQLWKQAFYRDGLGAAGALGFFGFRYGMSGERSVYFSHPSLTPPPGRSEEISLSLDGPRRFSEERGEKPGDLRWLHPDPREGFPREGFVKVSVAFLLDVLTAKELTIVSRGQTVTFDLSDLGLPMVAMLKEVDRRRQQPPGDPRPTFIHW
jgi:hypothetical protein